MAVMTFTTRDGSPWVPKYLVEIDYDQCIGCGRCFKVCTQDVLKLQGINEDGEIIDTQDEDDGDVERMVMVIANPGACIGCESCGTVCAKGTQKYAAQEI